MGSAHSGTAPASAASNGGICIPASGYTALIVGQDLVNVRNYTSTFGPAAGYMSYTALRSSTGDLAGLTESVDYGSGIECARCLIDEYNPPILQLGLWLVGSLHLINQGSLDQDIKLFVMKLDSISNNSHILLRVGYEFDNPFNYYDPFEYSEAFKRIVSLVKKEKTALASSSSAAAAATVSSPTRDLKISFVWHSYGEAPASNTKAADWYPGDDFVDICSVSVFQQPFQCQDAFKCSMPYIDDFLKFCKIHHKPLMIGESSPFGGIVDSDEDGSAGEGANEIGIHGSSWNRWFQVVISYIERHDIKYFSYISCNWDEQPMWNGAKFGDSRIQNFKSTSKKWSDIVLSSKRFSWNKDLAVGGDIDDAICNVGYKPDIEALIISYLSMLILAGMAVYFFYKHARLNGICSSNIVNRIRNDGQYVELREI